MKKELASPEKLSWIYETVLNLVILPEFGGGYACKVEQARTYVRQVLEQAGWTGTKPLPCQDSPQVPKGLKRKQNVEFQGNF